MIHLILDQIWNQRRQNLWIWLELAVLSAFLWITIDPLFTMTCLKGIPTGFDRDRIFFILPDYEYVYTAQNDETFVPRMDNLLTQLEAHPMVEAVCLGDTYQVPGGNNWSGSIFYRNLEHAKLDDGKPWAEQDNYTHAQWFKYPYFTGLEKWADIPYTLGLRDAISGEYIHGRPDGLVQKLTYVSAGFAKGLYGTPNVKDSTVYGNNETYRIDAVYANVKGQDFRPPYFSLFIPSSCDGEAYYAYGAIVRIKKGVDGDEFMEAVEHDVLRHCITGPVRDYNVTSLKQQMDMFAETEGANNVVRLQAALGFFGLLCVFLGVSGLFWVRCGERRQDIGVMRSLGASRSRVNRQMLLEATILLTAAFLVAMVFMAWYVHTYGYNAGLDRSSINGNINMSYWFLRPWPHVLAVTAISYTAMLLITLLATWLPVQRATRILPSDALRDE